MHWQMATWLNVNIRLRNLVCVRWRLAPRLLQAALLRYRRPIPCVWHLLTYSRRSGRECTMNRGCMAKVYTRRVSLRVSGG